MILILKIDQPIEAIYVFPIDDHAAVCEFEANIDGKIITGIVKPKNEAKEKYDKAVKKGHGAYLLEQRFIFFIYFLS